MGERGEWEKVGWRKKVERGKGRERGKLRTGDEHDDSEDKRG